MSNFVIFQVLGNLLTYKKANFYFEIENFPDLHSRHAKGYLASLSLAEILLQSNHNVKVVFFYPISFLECDDICTQIADCKKLDVELIQKKILELLSSSENQDLYVILKSFLQQGIVKIYPLLSMGSYQGQKTKHFYIHPETIAVQIFLMMKKEIEEEEKPDHILFDITTGLNPYIVELIEAGRAYLTYRKLLSTKKEDILKSDINFFTLSADPVAKGYITRVFILPFDVKAFLALPYSKKNGKIDISLVEGSGKVKGEFGRKMSKFKKCLELLLEKNLFRKFNAIKYGKALPLFYPEIFDDYELIERAKKCFKSFSEEEDFKSTLNKIVELLEEEFAKMLCETLKPLCEEKNTECEIFVLDKNFRFNSKQVFAVFFSLAMFRTINNLFLPENFNEKERDDFGVPLCKLKEIAQKFRETGFGMNAIFLERDIEEIEEVISFARGKANLSSWQELRQVFQKAYEIQTSPQRKKSTNRKRNFFAHTGFEKTMVEVRVSNGTTYVRYKLDESGKLSQQVKNEISSWLDDPES